MKTPAFWRTHAPKYSFWIALVLIIIWAANFSVQKFILAQIEPAGLLLVRYGFLLPICCIVFAFGRFGLSWPRISREDWWVLFRIGFIGHLLHVGLVTIGIDWSTPFSSSLLLAIGPVFTLLILRASGAAGLPRIALLGVAIALLGIIIFTSEKWLVEGGPGSWFWDGLSGGLDGGLGGRLSAGHKQWRASAGDLILVVAAFTFSLYTVKVKPINERLGIVTVMIYSTLLNAPIVVLFAAPLGWGSLDQLAQWNLSSLLLWLGLSYSIVLSAFIGGLLWAWVNLVRGRARSAPLIYLTPPFAGLFAWLTTGESMTMTKVIGAGIALAGVALAQFTSGKVED